MSPLKDMEWWNCSSTNISTSPLQSYWKANEEQRLPEARLTVHNLASAGMVVITSGSPKPSAALTNWIKLHWWETSCIPLWTPCSAGLGRNSRLIIPVPCISWSWGRAKQGQAEVGAQAGAGQGRAEPRHAGSSSICCLQMTHIWQLSPRPCQEEMSCGSNRWRFSFWGSLSQLFFILFYLLDFKFSFRLRNVWVPCQQRRDLCSVQIIVCLCLAQNPSYNIFLTN